MRRFFLIALGTYGLIAAIIGFSWWWIHLHLHHTSPSAGLADQNFLNGAIFCVTFVVAVLSFWRHPVTHYLLRFCIASWSTCLAFMVASEIWISKTGYSYSTLSLIGLFMGVFYLAITLSSTLPLIFQRFTFPRRILLHFGFFPLTLAVFYLGQPPEDWLRFSMFGMYLVSFGLSFILLCMRMYDLFPPPPKA